VRSASEDPWNDPAIPGNARRIVERGFGTAVEDPPAPEGEVVEESTELVDPMRPETVGEVVEGQLGLLDEDPNADAPGCSHPAPDRRLVDGEQVCSVCWEVVSVPQAIVPRDRPGTTDPTQREGDARSTGGLRHITTDPDATSRPYTPEEVEREIVDTLDRIERGAGYLTTQEEKRGAAKLEYELAYARALIRSTGRSQEQRNAEAMIACEELYERWQLLELTCRTAREGMHNLRSKLSGTQSVLRSVSDALRGAR
jgi:hypothetical protein